MRKILSVIIALMLFTLCCAESGRQYVYDETGAARFSVPEDWQYGYSSSNRCAACMSPDGMIMLISLKKGVTPEALAAALTGAEAIEINGREWLLTRSDSSAHYLMGYHLTDDGTLAGLAFVTAERMEDTSPALEIMGTLEFTQAQPLTLDYDSIEEITVPELSYSDRRVGVSEGSAMTIAVPAGWAEDSFIYSGDGVELLTGILDYSLEELLEMVSADTGYTGARLISINGTRWCVFTDDRLTNITGIYQLDDKACLCLEFTSDETLEGSSLPYEIMSTLEAG